METTKQQYVSPQISIERVKVEKGFATSQVSEPSDYFDGSINQMPFR